MNIDVGIGELKIADSSDVRFTTYGLGSCVAVVFHSPQLGIGGMAHIALPDSSIGRDKAAEQPAYFADTAISEMMRYLTRLSPGARSSFTFCIYGGASVLDNDSFFQIGRRNAVAVKQLLEEAGCMIAREDTGGSTARTVRLDIGTGEISVRSNDLPWHADAGQPEPKAAIA